MEFFDKIRKELCFLAEFLSPWIAMGRQHDSVQHGKTPYYSGCMEENNDNTVLVYIKGFKKREYLTCILNSDDLTLRSWMLITKI